MVVVEGEFARIGGGGLKWFDGFRLWLERSEGFGDGCEVARSIVCSSLLPTLLAA